MSKKGESVIIKKAPVVIAKNFILLQAGALIAYFVIGSLAYHAQIYRSLVISKIISFQIAQALVIFAIETLLVFYIFFRWHKEHIQIQNDKIILAKGIFYHHRTIIPLRNIASVNFHQGPLGKLIKYGTVELQDNFTNKVFKLTNFPNPQECVNVILDFQKAAKSEVKYQKTNLQDLLIVGEHEGLEFKSTFRWDLRENRVNRNLEKAVMKSIAAFLNSRGGYLVIGVDDEKRVVGVGADFSTLGKPNIDGFENHFSHVFNNMIGAELRQFVQLYWSSVDGRDCCIVAVALSDKPVYLRSDGNEEFYIRTGNGTTSLKFSEAAAFIDLRFRK